MDFRSEVRKIHNILKCNTSYEDNIKNYTKKDGLLSLLLFGIFVLAYGILGKLCMDVDFIKENIKIVGCFLNALLIILTLAFVKLNKENLDTLGLYKGKWKTSFFIGIIYASILFFNNCGSYLIQGYSLYNIKQIAFMIVYYLSVALSEELVFRGYIGTRIYGLIKNKWIAISLVGVLFVIMHFPYRLITGVSIQNLTIYNIGWLLNLFITHIILNFIYIKTNSIYGSIIPHWISNLAYNIVIR